MLRRLDSSVLEVWTIAVSLQRRALAELAEQPDGLGSPAAKRLLIVIRGAGAQIVRCASELGFSPPRGRARQFPPRTWRPGPAVITGDKPHETIEEYLARGQAMDAARRAKASRRDN